jgi:hypothetical protein
VEDRPRRTLVVAAGPAIVAPQFRTTAAPPATTGPVIVPPSTSSDSPEFTLTGPVTTAFGVMQIACPAATVNGPVCAPVTHGSL